MTFETRLRKFALPPLFQGKTALLAATMLASALSACSSVPDAVNPIEWYKGTRDLVTGGDEEKAKDAASPAASSAARNEPAGDFPSLSTVPERPAVTPENQRALAARGLAADAERAKYSDEDIRRDTGAGAARPAGVSGPAPQEQAQAPVQRQQIGGVAPPPASTQPSGKAMSAQEVFQRRIAEQNSSKLTPEMMQGFFTPEAAPVVVGGRPAPAPAATGPTPKSISLGTAAAAIIPFEQGSADLTPAANAQLRQLADNVIAQNRRLRIAGHSSNRSLDALPGTDISAARANAVARAMIGLGVAPGQIAVAALADTQPVSNVEAANRRVEIFVE
jgi:flagellar motor protein MotB